MPDDFIGIVEVCDGMSTLKDLSICHVKNQTLHNENGPAREYFEIKLDDIYHPTIKQWFLNDESFEDEEEWKIELEKHKSMKKIVSP